MKLNDIQTLLASGLPNLRHARFLLLSVHDAAKARVWLSQPSVMNLVVGASQSGRGALVDEALAIAFTYRGLKAWREVPHDDFPFPSAFCEGMNQPDRAQALGDENVAQWRWGDVGEGTRREVHVLLAHYRERPFVDEGPLSETALASGGLGVAHTVLTCASYIEPDDDSALGESIGKPGLPSPIAAGQNGSPKASKWKIYEPFGFRDGLSQPRLRDNPPRASTEHPQHDHDVAWGEFVLGLPNEYGDTAYAPDLQGWPGPNLRFGVHGSYIAVRQIRQHVDAFRAFEAAHPAADDAPSVVEKMVGRRKDGRSLCPAESDADPINGFRYRVLDAQGFHCPVGAHIRRSNPRDTLGWDSGSGIASSKRHRILRRARIFIDQCKRSPGGGCQDASRAQDCGQGLFFMALNADLDRQFEFIQQHWIMNRRFGDQADEDDPLLGARRRFTVPAAAIGGPPLKLPQFTALEGGGYFFLPGLSALRYLARPCASSSEPVVTQGTLDAPGDEPRQWPDACTPSGTQQQPLPPRP